MELVLKQGINPRNAADAASSTAQTAENYSQTGQNGAAQFSNIRQWAERAESSLKTFFDVGSVQGFIWTSRLSHLLTLEPASQSMIPMSDSEFRSQAQRLYDVADEIHGLIDCYCAGDGRIVVPDTNAVVRMHPLLDINWTKFIGEKVRVVLPLRIVEELDAMKYGTNQEFRIAVRKLLPRIEGVLDEANASIAELPSGDSLEILVPPGHRSRPTNADEETLEECINLQSFSQQSVILITLDTNMRTRARALGLSPVRPAPDLLLGKEKSLQLEAESVPDECATEKPPVVS